MSMLKCYIYVCTSYRYCGRPPRPFRAQSKLTHTHTFIYINHMYMYISIIQEIHIQRRLHINTKANKTKKNIPIHLLLEFIMNKSFQCVLIGI